MDDDETPRPPPAGWLEAIARGKADLAAGRTVPAERVLADMHAANERMIARQTKKGPDAA